MKKSYLWYTNTETHENIKIATEDVVPDGFTRGRYLSKEHRDNISRALTGKTLTETHKNNIKDGLINKSFNPNTNGGKICINNGITCKYIYEKEFDIYESQGWIKGSTTKGIKRTDEFKQKVSKAAKNMSEESKLKRVRSWQINYNNKTDEQKRIIREKHSYSMNHRSEEQIAQWRKNLGFDDPEKTKNRVEKGINTKRKNHTFNVSIPENTVYQYLQTIFDVSDIFREYKDPRYPYYCDFYIKSRDLFIECNFHWTHGSHPFNENNKEDLKLLEIIRSKQYIDENGKRNSFFTFEDVWTNRDVIKLQTLKSNNLNYLFCYSLNEFEEKIDAIRC